MHHKLAGWLASSHVREVIIGAVDQDYQNVQAAGLFSAHGNSTPLAVVVVQKPGRGSQLNAAASKATGDILLFNHADTELTGDHLQALVELMAEQKEIVGGAFYRFFDDRHPWCRWLSRLERRHNECFGSLYGDQSLFVRRSVFHNMGGFADIPLMEDVEFSKRLRKVGKIKMLEPEIASSARRYSAQGAWKTTLRNMWIHLLYAGGVSPRRLHRLYYGRQAEAE